MILAIDTATHLLSLALHDYQRLRAEYTWEAINQHSVELAPAIERLFQQVEVRATDLTAIAIAQGPGSYTGVRIGMSAAKGMALVLDIPLIPMMTLDILAAATPYVDGQLAIVLSAGRGRVMRGYYTWQSSQWQLRSPMDVLAWPALLAEIEQPTWLNGDIPATIEADLAQTKRPVTVFPPVLRLRRAGFLAQLAVQKYQSGDIQNAALVTPFYLKQPESATS